MKLIILLCLALARAMPPDHGEDRVGRNVFTNFLGNIGILKVIPRECETSSSYLKKGMCSLESKCLEASGAVAGECERAGICCVVPGVCGSKVAVKRSWFVNQEFPESAVSPYNKACELTILKYDETVKQVRLDLSHFKLHGSVYGKCSVDSLRVYKLGLHGEEDVIPQLCGDNSNQHVYIDMPNGENAELKIQIKIGSSPARTTTERSWRIYVTQLDEKEMAPSGCLQYYEDRSAKINSLNYNADEKAFVTNMDYDICFRKTEQLRIEADEKRTDPTSYNICGRDFTDVKLEQTFSSRSKNFLAARMQKGIPITKDFLERAEKPTEGDLLFSTKNDDVITQIQQVVSQLQGHQESGLKSVVRDANLLTEKRKNTKKGATKKDATKEKDEKVKEVTVKKDEKVSEAVVEKVEKPVTPEPVKTVTDNIATESVIVERVVKPEQELNTKPITKLEENEKIKGESGDDHKITWLILDNNKNWGPDVPSETVVESDVKVVANTNANKERETLSESPKIKDNKLDSNKKDNIKEEVLPSGQMEDDATIYEKIKQVSQTKDDAPKIIDDKVVMPDIPEAVVAVSEQKPMEENLFDDIPIIIIKDNEDKLSELNKKPSRPVDKTNVEVKPMDEKLSKPVEEISKPVDEEVYKPAFEQLSIPVVEKLSKPADVQVTEAATEKLAEIPVEVEIVPEKVLETVPVTVEQAEDMLRKPACGGTYLLVKEREVCGSFLRAAASGSIPDARFQEADRISIRSIENPETALRFSFTYSTLCRMVETTQAPTTTTTTTTTTPTTTTTTTPEPTTTKPKRRVGVLQYLLGWY